MLIEKKVAQKLSQQKKTLSVAESCSGGLLSKKLTDIPGSSKYFMGGIVAYHNDLKTHWLKIPKATLQKLGAVSSEVAVLMAMNIKKTLHTDFGISITGIAGPSGGSKTKPVGLVFIALSAEEEQCERFVFKGNRASIREQAVQKALELFLQSL